MDVLIRVLIERLVNKGMEVSCIPSYIRDLGNTIAVNGYADFEELNKRLQLLGWDGFDLDEHTFQLISAVFEQDLAHRPPCWFERIISSKGLNN